MTLRVAARLLGQPAALRPSTILAAKLGPTIQYRQKWAANPIRRLKKMFGGTSNTTEKQIAPELDDPKARDEHIRRTLTTRDAEGGIFEEELKSAETKAADSAQLRRNQRTSENMAIVTDPDPRARVRWQRRKVIQMVRNRGQVTREERIKMTEREHLHTSKFLPTSTKKLVMLSRQIAGKTLDDAITQMQWSKKKMAAEIKYYLEEARDLAIAERGMGLGRVNGEIFDKPQKIQTKEGKWLEITDPTRMYIAQSWVNRGKWRGKSLDYKARASFGIMKHPATSISILLKEEKTRIREYQELETKKRNQGPWVHHPNRAIYGQRPYYAW